MFLVPFLYMRPPSSHTWALLCTQDELSQVQKVRGVPLSEIGGVLPGTREVGALHQSTALFARVEAFWLRWEKEARSDMLRKVEAETRNVAEGEGEDVAFESLLEENPPFSRRRGAVAAPLKVPGKVPGVSSAGQTSELVRLRSENELLKGMVGLLEDQVVERDTQLAAVRGERQRADALPKERDAQLWRSAARPRRPRRRGEPGRRSPSTSWRLRVGNARRSSPLPSLWLCQRVSRMTRPG